IFASYCRSASELQSGTYRGQQDTQFFRDSTRSMITLYIPRPSFYNIHIFITLMVDYRVSLPVTIWLNVCSVVNIGRARNAQPGPELAPRGTPDPLALQFVRTPPSCFGKWPRSKRRQGLPLALVSSPGDGARKKMVWDILAN